jgi:hypothetical protein
MDKTSMKPAFSLAFGKALLFAGSLAGLIFGAVACADAEGTTPECIQNVKQGSHDVIDEGCTQFAVCLKPDANGKLQRVDAEECCKQLTNEYEHDMCLYGHGAGPAPNAPGSGG